MNWPLLVKGSTFRALKGRYDKCQLELSRTQTALKAAKRAARDATEALKNVTDQHSRDTAEALRAQQTETAQREWCPPQSAELPPELNKQCPLLVEATSKALCGAVAPGVRSMAALVNQSSFSSPSLWALYWVLVHGADAVQERLQDGINENGLTTAFGAAIADAAKDYRKLFSDAIALEIGFAKLFEHTGENLQEVDAGADLVLVVSGEQLTPSGGARLLWFQAKRRVGGNSPLLLSYKQANSKHGTQCAALKRRHVPTRGSFASYVNYAEGLPLVAAIPVEVLDEEGTSADVNEFGVRIQEHVLSRVVDATARQFDSAEDVFDFLEEAESSSGLPIEVMTLDSPNSGLGQELVAKIKALDRQRRQERNRGQGYGL